MDINELREIPYFDQPPRKVVSLIPSMTENLFLLGFGSFVVGITDYCIHPVDMLVNAKRLGGPKNPAIGEIVGLSPDLVIINQEENSPQIAEELLRAGVKVWMTFPKSVDDAIDVLYSLLGLFKDDRAAIQLKSLQTALDFARLSGREMNKFRYFCPIWMDNYHDQDWMMTFNQNTYPDNLLKIFGGDNVFKDRERYYPISADLGVGNREEPEGRDTRYPRVPVTEILEKDPELIFLPNEPFKFEQSHLEKLKVLLEDTTAVKKDRMVFIDGSLLFWPGVRLGQSLLKLPELIYHLK